MDFQLHQLVQAINEGRKEDLATLRRELDQRLGAQDKVLTRIEEYITEDQGPRLKKLEETKARASGAKWVFVGLITLAEAWYHIKAALKP